MAQLARVIAREMMGLSGMRLYQTRATARLRPKVLRLAVVNGCEVVCALHVVVDSAQLGARGLSLAYSVCLCFNTQLGWVARACI